MADTDDLQRQFYEMLLESQWWTAAELRAYQRSQLSQLLRHAKANVPFYEARLDAVLKANGDIDWERWHEIPIVTRGDMVQHVGVMQARELPPGHGPTSISETSGSSGVAIAITTNRLSQLANNGLRWRGQLWNELDWSRGLLVRDGSDPNEAAPPRGKRTGVWGPPWEAVAQEGWCLQINKLASGEELLRLARDAHCDYVNTGPKTAHTLALDANRLGLDVRIEAFLCQGEAVNDADRAAARSAFGARLIEHYSAKEGGQIAHPCEAGHLHVNSECVLMEIIREDGRPAETGQAGRVVVTPFFHTAQPLIRYAQGDWAVAGAPCSCGRHLPVVDSILGRELAIFRHPDGRALVQVLPMAARHALHCHFMQVAQVGANTYEVRYVPRDGAPAVDETLFMEHFRRVWFDDAEVAFRPVDSIPLTQSGKMLEYVNEWNAA